MIKRISLTAALIATTFTLGACSEVPQGVVAAKKGDEKAYVAADNKYVEKGWTSGDQVTWEKQLKTRSQGQDDYVKAK
jgi:starvation-inducible outer membrane lipoprotein